MKKLKVFGLAAMAVGMATLTSCLSGGGNTGSGGAYGVAAFSTDAGGIVVKDDAGTVVAATAFNTQISEGDYVGYAYTIDFDNQPSTKYLTATVSYVEKYKKSYADSFLTDTSKLITNEMTVEQVQVARLAYESSPILTANKSMFLFAGHLNIAPDMKIQYDLSYNGDLEPATVDGKRVYEFFLRAVKLADGEKTKQNLSVTSVFDLNMFIGRFADVEKSAGNSTLNFQINFINEFNKDSTSWAWKKSEVFMYAIPEK